MADPIWIAEVLRAAGLKVREINGWRDRGHGDFGNIWGVVCHHTGNNRASAESIAFHPDLGLASQLHLAQDGTYTVCGVGVAWHAGQGSWPGLPTNNANYYTIGIEAANDGTSGWPRVQYDAYVRGVAAILKRLGQPASHAIGHKEWGAIQGKWDPGGIDMKRFRADVAAAMNDKPAPPPENLIDREQRENPWLGARKTKGEITCPDGKGKFAEFENGHVYFRDGVGCFAIPHGGLFEAWASYGYEKGQLGYPVRDFTKLPDGGVQAFQGGVLYRKDGYANGFYVHGEIGKFWANLGYEKSDLGYPVSNEYKDPDGNIRQDFEHGQLIWPPKGVIQIRK